MDALSYSNQTEINIMPIISIEFRVRLGQAPKKFFISALNLGQFQRILQISGQW